MVSTYQISACNTVIDLMDMFVFMLVLFVLFLAFLGRLLQPWGGRLGVLAGWLAGSGAN